MNLKTTKKVYFSDLLKRRDKTLCNELCSILDAKRIAYEFLSNTTDIWVRDFMPIQISENEFVMYHYKPDYLLDGYVHLISDPEAVFSACHIDALITITDLVIDGGNIILGDDFLIMTDKILYENPTLSEAEIRIELKSKFKVERVILIPTMLEDMFGRCDGLIRYIGGNKLALAHLHDKEYLSILIQIILNAEFDFDFIPDVSHLNDSYISATGIYTNFLELTECIIVPLFDLDEDKLACDTIEKIFGKEVVGINAYNIAEMGGVLNCISWDLKTK